MPRVAKMGSLVEWLTAIIAAAVVLWLGFTWIGPRLASSPPTPSGQAEDVPAGVPAGAQNVSLLVLIDGTQVRVGDPQVNVHARLGESGADPMPLASPGPFGDRLVREYERHGTRFFLVCERTEPGGPVKVARIYLPR